MAKAASAKPLLCPVTHLDDLGQRSKHALIGHELCLGAPQLHGNGALFTPNISSKNMFSYA